ncbi:hypothetical protein ACSBR2_002517 [Camellia fascicularis]
MSIASQEHLDKIQLRQNYRNLWHTDLVGTIQIVALCFGVAARQSEKADDCI